CPQSATSPRSTTGRGVARTDLDGGVALEEVIAAGRPRRKGDDLLRMGRDSVVDDGSPIADLGGVLIHGDGMVDNADTHGFSFAAGKGRPRQVRRREPGRHNIDAGALPLV